MLNNKIETEHGTQSIYMEMSILILTRINIKCKEGNARSNRTCLGLGIKIKTFDAAFPPWVITGKINVVAPRGKTDVSLEDEKLTLRLED